MTNDFPIEVSHFLSEKACAEAIQTIDDLRTHWLSRSNAELYTLGAAAYLDALEPRWAKHFGKPETDPAQYYQNAQQYNPILQSHFGWLYDTMVQFLEDKLHAPVSYREDLAWPGFHIFLHSPANAFGATHVPHFDRAFVTLNWDTSSHVDFKQTLSFTLTLQLPQIGGGLKLWDVEYDQVTQLPKEEAKALVRAQKSQLVPYEVGGLICHSGNQLHQISPWKSQPEDRRITLQGHGLLCDGVWILYW